MKIECVSGIVIHDTNYSESSKILNILTKEHGLIGVLSRGCRNIRSRLRSVSRKLIYGNFHIYYKENGLSTLISVDVISSFSNILTDLDRITYASYILDLTYQILRENKNEDVFDLLKNSLKKIDDKLDPLVITNILEVKYLDFFGVGLVMDRCCICGSQKDIITLDSSNGGLVCKNCFREGSIVKSKTIELLRMFYYVDLERLDKINISFDNMKEVSDFILEYYDKYTGVYLKSRSLLDTLSKISIS